MIYILDNDPKLTAQYLDDKSLDKMIKDIAQVLCNAHHELNWKQYQLGQKRISDVPMLFTEYGTNKGLDEWSQWARECFSNYKYLVELGIECCREFHFRNGEKCDEEKVYDGDDHCGAWHKMRDVIDWARDNVPDLPKQTKSFGGYSIFGEFKVTEVESCIPTLLPLVMPKRFHEERIVVNEKYETMLIPRITLEQRIQAYRNYYQVKLKQKLQHCNSIFESAHEISGGHGESRIEIKWTNRNKPEWLEV